MVPHSDMPGVIIIDEINVKQVHVCPPVDVVPYSDIWLLTVYIRSLCNGTRLVISVVMRVRFRKQAPLEAGRSTNSLRRASVAPLFAF